MELLTNYHFKNLGNYLLLIVIFCLYGISASATHIVGGEISYECIGNNEYIVELEVYVDCGPASFAYFDTTAFIALLDGDTNYIETLEFPLDFESEIELIEPEVEGLCLAAMPELCIERSTGYIDTITLPQNDSGYFLMYQRCCRNQAVVNVEDPTGIGATYLIKVPPNDIASCNNSPTFDALPPIVTCANEPLILDYSATDIDGDSLVYELCTPFVGGSTQQPVIDGEPSFPIPNIVWANGFSENNQFPSSPALTVDAETGILTAFPNQLGHYIVGVCVNEYRDGILLNSHLRDYQFVVTDCQLLSAEIGNTQIDADGNIILNACSSTVNFESVGYAGDNFYWDFGDSASSISYSYNENPSYEFTTPGQYMVSLLTFTPFCSDSTSIIVNVDTSIETDYEYELTCFNDPVLFADLSANVNDEMEYNWTFGDGGSSSEKSPTHNYSSPGTYTVILTITDINDCHSSKSRDIIVPGIPTMSIANETVCVDNQSGYLNLNPSEDLSSLYSLEWNYSDGFTSNDENPFYIFEEEGDYYISLQITNGANCISHSNATINVIASPFIDAGTDFNIEIGEEIYLDGDAEHAIVWYNQSGLVDNYLVPVNNAYYYASTTSPQGCTSIDSLKVIVEKNYRLIAPNAFSPNNDGVNDEFGFISKGIKAINSFRVFNRYGQSIFESNDIQATWDGTFKNKSQPIGSYIYYIEGLTFEDDVMVEKGNVTLVR